FLGRARRHVLRPSALARVRRARMYSMAAAAALAVGALALEAAAQPPSSLSPATPSESPDADVLQSTDAGAGATNETKQTEEVKGGNDGTRTVKEIAPAHEGHFEFGSYGRVWAASDLRGGLGRGTNVVAFGPRIVDEGSYGELELRREDAFSEKVKSRIVATLALFPPFFHFTGKATQAIGVRNLYAQGTYERVTI